LSPRSSAENFSAAIVASDSSETWVLKPWTICAEPSEHLREHLQPIDDQPEDQLHAPRDLGAVLQYLDPQVVKELGERRWRC
jgi:hypothetical protein